MPEPKFDPIAEQYARSAALFNPQSPEHAPEITRISMPEISAEHEREQRTGTVRIAQRGHLLPGQDRAS